VKYWIIILFSGLFSTGFSQKETTWWYFGRGAGLEFTSGFAQVDTNNQFSTGGGATSMSDDEGNLLYYTDTDTIWNRLHQPMPNGTGLTNGLAAEQNSISIPRPNRPGQYFVFNVVNAISYPTDGLLYHIVDMELDSGLGDVLDTAKNIHVVDSTEEKIAATPHANGVDYWLMVKRSLTDKYYCYLITELGPINPPVISSGAIASAGYSHCEGNLRFNHTGNMLAHLSGLGLEILDFDNSTGILSNSRFIIPFEVNDGLEFSADDSKLYSGGPIQYDLIVPTQTAIQASELWLDNTFAPAFMAGLQMGLIGKIYGNAFDGGANAYYMDIIHNPNELGSACNYQDSAIHLLGRTGVVNVPNFLSSFFKMNFYADSVCVGEEVEFSLNYSFVDSVFWNFGDPGSGSLNTDTALSPKHIYSDTGSYTVTLIAQNGIKTDTVVKTIYVKGVPSIDLGPDQEICSVDQDSITLGNHGLSGVYEWSDGSNDSTLLVVAENIAGSASIWLRYTNECGTDRDTIELIVSKPLSVSLLNDTAICLDTMVLSPTVINENQKTRFKWNTEELGRNILAISNGAGENVRTYSLVATNACGNDSDSVSITFIANPDGYLPDDSLYCSEIPFYVLNSQSKGITYEWGDGTSGPQFRIDSSSTVSLLSYSLCDTLSESFAVEFVPIPKPDLGSDTAICLEEEVRLRPIQGVPDGLNFIWSTVENDSIISITDTGIYSVTVTLKSCTRVDSVAVYERGDCYERCKPKLANIITPNADGINDNFGSNMTCDPTDYRLQVYNRWGQIIFESTEKTFTWDGYVNGSQAADGTYFYLLSYISESANERIEYRGSLTLLH
jgi:gliding motility-associated-like protein